MLIRLFLNTFFATIQCCGKSANAYALQSLISFAYTRRYFTNEQSAMLRVTQIFVQSASQVVGVQLVGKGAGGVVKNLAGCHAYTSSSYALRVAA